jgi:GrpB-like predicted nucleotidyltransferase (UPF0157 family)
LTQPIEIVDYDPSWPRSFEAEAALLAEALGDRVVGDIHHVGSTAVPGLGAKPIIDILAGVRDLSEARECIPLVEPLRYSYAPYREHEMAWFCKPGPDVRTHHLHLVPVDSTRYRAELAFRDRLRGDGVAAREYEALKRELAARHAEDREAYTKAKAAFIVARI